ncbi:MAG: SPOR domain-containing protein [Burkholderiaceae bacterium]
MPTHQEPADILQPSAAPADSAITTLYRAALGPMATERYLSRFAHFDHLGRTRPGWNTAASLFTLSWMALRYLWGPALIYVAAAEGLALLVFGVGRAQLQWPDAVHWGLIAVFGLLAFLLPGLFGDAILHTEIRKRIARALAATRTIPEACTLLERQAGSFRRLYGLAGINLLLLAAAIAAYVVVPAEDDSDRRATHTASPAIVATAPASEAAPAMVSASAAQAANDGDAPAPAPAASDEAAPAPAPAAAAWTPPSDASRAVAPPRPASSATTSPPAGALPSSAGSASRSKQRPPPRQAQSPAAAPSAASAALAVVGSTPGYYINVGLFAEEPNARKTQARLLNEGFPAFRQTLKTAKGPRIRVRVGPYASAKEARAAAARIRSLQFEAVVFRQ